MLARRVPVLGKVLNWDRQAFLSRSYFVLALGFGTLIALIAILGIGAIRRARAIYTEMETTQDAYLQAESFRRDIATDMYLADILVRDYLLDPSPQNAPLHRQQLLEIRSSLQTRLDQLAGSASDTDSPRLEQLQNVVQRYWDSLDPIFDWTPQEKADKSWYFLRHKILPRRQAVVDLAREMARLNRENLERERERTRHSRRVLESFLYRMIGFALSFGCLVALLSTYRVAALEKKQQEQHKQIEETQSNLRKLSRRLVQAQEGERKALSRELHDEVGQTMTALGIEISNLEKLRHSDPEAFHNRIEDAKQLNTKAMQIIRDLAMGLRPSMLDDLGLEPALRWQGREFSRRTGVPASVQVTGLVDELSDAQRTSIYRIVQEALTNCARHAQAMNVLVSVCAEGTQAILVVQDDGVGFDATARSRSGLGLLGIQERVQDLEGSLRISSEKNKGTTLRVEIPIGVTT
jgi:signal transduction histidine kinase